MTSTTYTLRPERRSLKATEERSPVYQMGSLTLTAAFSALDWLQVRYFEVVDQMVLQLIKRLWIAEKSGGGKFSILVTGDHSTPALFGDHSHEPVPLAVAHVR